LVAGRGYIAEFLRALGGHYKHGLFCVELGITLSAAPVNYTVTFTHNVLLVA